MSSADQVDIIFTVSVRDEWRRRPSEELIWRLKILEASGPYPSDQGDAMSLARFRAIKAAWEAYLSAANACGMLEGPRGSDIRARLGSRDPANFRSAMAECMTCWFLHCHLGLPVVSDAPGRDAKACDMALKIGGMAVGVEVKAPYRARPANMDGWSGGEDDKLSEAINAANKQFDDQCPNLLVLIPELRASICEGRTDLLRAAFGASYMTLDVDPVTHLTGPLRFEFDPAGRFLKPQKPRGLPGCRRVSGILCIEPETITTNCESILDLWFFDPRRNEAVVRHRALIMHNPHAYRPLPCTIWKDYPQLVPDGGRSMKWTDGAPVYV